MTKNRVFFKVFFIASVIGLATGLIFFNVKKAKAETPHNIYEMVLDEISINDEYNLGYGGQYNNSYYLYEKQVNFQLSIDIVNSGYCYKIYRIDENFNKNILDNCYTFFYSTPIFYDGYYPIYDYEQDDTSMAYRDNAMCFIGIVGSNSLTYDSVIADITAYIQQDDISYYKITGGNYEGQSGVYYYTSINNITSLMDITSNYNYIYLVIKADESYLTMLEANVDDVFSGNYTYNYPSIYFSSIKPTTIVNGRTEEEYRQYGAYMYEEGYDYGNQRGYDIGYNDGQQDGYEYGYEQGYDIGYDTGYDTGIIGGDPAIYEQGYNAGVKSNSTNMGTTIAAFFQAIGNVLSIKIFGNTITLGTLIFVPVVLGLLWAILKIIRG